jgi:hypothetical protein
LFAALSAAQGEITNPDKNAVNTHYSSQYADLAEVLNTIRPVFLKHGLAIIQSPSFDGKVASVTTILAHKTGGYIIDTASCVPGKTDGQGIGAATTYLRRYSAAAFAGIAQEDDDGESAKHDTAPRTHHSIDEVPPENPRPPTRPVQQTLPTQPAQSKQWTAKPTKASIEATQQANAAIHEKTTLNDIILMDSKQVAGVSKKSGKPYTLYAFSLSNGMEVTTFTEALAAKALKLVDDTGSKPANLEVQPGFKEGTVELLSVEPSDEITP